MDINESGRSHSRQSAAQAGQKRPFLLAGGQRLWKLMLPAVLLGVVACDTEVTNPGPVVDEFLTEPTAFEALVGGMIFAAADAQNWIAFDGAVAARELTASGGIGAHGFTVLIEQGVLDPIERNGVWWRGHQARFVAENGIERFRQGLGAEFGESRQAASALVWAGFANRMLGENMCAAVFDGGPAEPSEAHFERALAQFSEGLEVARAAGEQTLEYAALAGRASVRGWLGDWAGAEQDAERVPHDFTFDVPRSLESPDVTTNRFARANQNNPWRSHSVYETYFEQYYLDSQDPRASWDRDPDIPLGDGRGIPWYYETKYGARGEGLTAPIRLTSGAEARLIIAEARLRSGDWQEALSVLNAMRTDAGVPLRQAAGPDEVWTTLKLERFIELWLEARALWDLRRYTQEQIPGDLPEAWDMTGRDLCFPISEDERLTNPNIPVGG